MDAGLDSPFYEWLAESFRSIAPRAEAIGLVKKFEFDSMRSNSNCGRKLLHATRVIPGPTMAGCFARKP
jgi:hypothetical protein